MGKILFLFFLVVANIAFAVEERGKATFSSDNEYLLETRLDEGTVLTESLVSYKYSNQWYFPLYELTSRLGLSFVSNPEKSFVQGDIVLDVTHLDLSLKECWASLNKEKISFDCKLLVVFDEEVYLAQSLFEKLFPLKFSMEELKSQLVLNPLIEFPTIKKLKRAQNLPEGTQEVGRELEYGHSVKAIEKHVLDGFSADFLLGSNYVKSSSGATHEMKYQVNSGGELLGFETRFDFTGHDQEFDTWFLNFRKISEEERLLGPLQAKQIDLFHYYFPSMPLVGSYGKVRGFALTNHSLSQPSSFSKHDFQGELPSDWDVELYQNNLLVGRQQGSSSGQYRFKDVPLLYGVNRFELIFYGPLGQERHEYKTFRIDSTMPRGQKIYYRAALGATEDSEDLKSLSLEKSIYQRFSFGAQYSEAVLENENHKREYMGGSLNGFADSFHYSVNYAKELQGGNVWQGSLSIPYRYANFKLDHARLNRFFSREFSDNSSHNSLTQQNKFEIFIPFFSRFLTRTLFLQDDYREGQEIQRIRSMVSYSASFAGLDNEAEWDSSSKLWLTEPLLHFNYNDYTWRLGTKYQESFGFLSYKTDFRNSLSEVYDLLLAYSRDLILKQNEYSLALTRFFDKFSLSFQTTAQDTKNYSLSLNLSLGFVREPRQGTYTLSHSSLRDKGSASLVVFEDLNQNGIFDKEEKPLSDVQVRVLQTNQIETTNSEGIVFLTDLPLYTNLDVALVMKSLPNIQYRPLEKGYRFMTQLGSSQRFEIPVGLFGDLDGSILVKKKNGESVKRGIFVSLITPAGEKIKELRTDSDGYYTFEGLKPGVYKVVATYGQRSLTREVMISPSGEFVGGVDFVFEVL